MTAFINNLRASDQVFDVELQRRGLVSTTPREGNRNTAVIFDGTATARYRDITHLRFIPPGEKEPEDVAPFEGELPAIEEKQSRPSATPSNPAIATLEARRATIKAKIEAMSKEAAVLRAEDDRIEKAIAVLKS